MARKVKSPSSRFSAQRAVPKPAFRSLQVYAFDPSRGRNYGNYMTLRIPFEYPLKPGPVGEYVAVVDYDPANNCYYEPVDLNDRWILANDGLDPAESDPRFHQQMVYAVVSETIKRFKFALGRDIRWRRGHKDSALGNRLLLIPHGMQEANAFYDPKMHAIVFGYFTASETDPGSNIPGQMIFTCLAHDIIVHETTHALVDGIRRFFMEPTNIDVAAFHEAFADIVALFQHFSQKEALLEALRGTRGTLFRTQMSPGTRPSAAEPVISAEQPSDNPLVILGKQFGDAIGLHRGLREALGTPANPKALEDLVEPHDRGSILVAAVFDAFFTTFLHRTADLWRIAGVSRDDARDVNLQADLLARLAEEASKTAGHFETLCIRALDYCPPVDITFGDYLRALITADHDLVRDDDRGYRAALIDAFRLRGIHPQSVTSYSEESLLWTPPDKPCTLPGLRMPSPDMDEQERASISKKDAQKIYGFAQANAEFLGIANPNEIFVSTFHAINRVSPDGDVEHEMVAEVIEKGPGAETTGEPATFGGATIVFDAQGKVRYAIRKSLKGDRAEAQAAFRQEVWERTAFGPYEPYRNLKLDFRSVHRGF